MKNTIIITVIIASMILSPVHASAAGNECKKTRRCKTKAELLKFSLNDFVGKEDSQAEKIDLNGYPATDKPEKAPAEKEISSSKVKGK